MMKAMDDNTNGIEMTSVDDEEFGEMNKNNDYDARIGSLPPRRQSSLSKLKIAIVSLAVVLIAAAGYRYGGIYLMEEGGSQSLVDGENQGGDSGIVTDQFENAKAQDAFNQAQENSGGHHPGGGWFANHKNGPGKHIGKHHNGTALGPGGNHGGAGSGGGGGGHHSSHSNNNNNYGNNGGGNNDNNSETESSSGNSGLCEDTTQYDDWHSKTVTLQDGAKFEVLDQFEHDKDAFTQGLTYANDVLYESTGLYGHSTVRILDPDTADVIKSVPMDNTLFGEGMAFVDDKLIQITWKRKRGFIYDANTLETLQEFTYKTTTTQGWGITWDACNNEYIVTDGSEYLHFWDPETMETSKEKVRVHRMDGSLAKELNEIEFWRGRVLANVWYEDVLLVIHPETGVVEKEYDFSTLWPKSQRIAAQADVFNGISISKEPDVLYVTGKKWNRMFKIRLLV